ncbi:hypothetical protein OHA21_43880 [Actinoplanes sp. NBC_00393]|uniref:hypothetical protein n=1 Tax=Actinoplanes sp. NBC_00393 TaxID=2975953 RepID=UPI002E1F0EEB
MTTVDPSDVTTGELSRGLSRVEREMREGFSAIRKEISGLSFVPAAVYAADMLAYRDKIQRLEGDLDEERQERREDQKIAQQRSWQASWSIRLAIISMPLSLAVSVAAGLLIAALK